MQSITKNRIVRALSPTRLSARVVMAVALAGVLTAACDVHGVSAPGTLMSISVSPNATLVAGSTQQMVAVGYDADGRVTNITPTWSVASSGGTIASSGLFTAGTVPGLFANTVVASVGNISGRASITVTPGALATITVVPTPVTLAVTTKQQFTAVGKDVSGNIVTLSPTWSVIAGGGAIGQDGMFTAGNVPGSYTNTVQASSNTIRGFATVNVTVGPLTSLVVTPNPDTLVVGTTQQFLAVGRDAGGNVLPVAVIWSVAALGGTIDGGGLFTAGPTPGTYTNTVKATSGTMSATATVVVKAGALAIITVSPTPATLAIGATQQFTAVGTDVAGNPVAITPTWDVVALGGTINATSGLFTAGTVSGTFANTVRASANGLSGRATVVVTTGPLASITVTPNPVTMPGGTVQQFVAVGKDANNNVFTIAPTWSVVNGGGVINSSGIFTAGSNAGTFTNTVQATSGAISGTATVTVTVASPPLASILVTPTPVSVQTSATQQFTASGRDPNGNLHSVNPVWSVVNGGGTISATGLFTAGLVVGTYNNTIKATDGSISGFATVTVTVIPPVLTTITVTPDPASVVTGANQTFTATGRDQLGNVFVFTPVWSVINGGGTIDNATGVFTAGAVGTYNNTVKAANASGTIFNTATVTVTAAPVGPFVNLGTAQTKAIFGSTAVSCSSASIIGTAPGNGDVSISPTGAFTPGLCTFLGTLDQNTGTSAITRNDVINAFNILNLLPKPAANVVAGLGGGAPLVCSAILSPCVYWSGSSIAVTGALTLDGGGFQDAVFVFLAGSTINGEAPSSIILQNGAKAKNVYWVAGTSSTLKTGSIWQGNILANQSIDMNANATLLGRALAINAAVTLLTGNSITLP